MGATLLHTISFYFDKVGNLELVGDANATYDYQYDGLNRQKAVIQSIAGLTPAVRLDHDYDAAGRMTTSKATIGGVADYENGYFYDAANRLVGLTQLPQSASGAHAVAYKVVELGYNKAQQLASVKRYSADSPTTSLLTSSYSYDAAGRVQQIAHGSAVTHSYVWNDANRLASYTNSDDGSVTYAYDARGQLTGADYSGAWTQWLPDETYDYDDNGNRELANNQTYQTGANNRLLSDGVWSYQYDNSGNVVRKTNISSPNQAQVFTWDHRNRLTRVAREIGGVITYSFDYKYDYLNQLISRTFDPDGNVGSAAIDQVFSIYDQGQVALEFQKNSAGNLNASNLSRRYLWGPAVDQLLAEEQVDWGDSDADGEVLWALADHLGSVQDVIDSQGDLRIHRAFDAFGNVASQIHDNGFVVSDFAYTGKYLNSYAGLQNNLNRWYDPEIGRWMSEDPIGFAGGDANLYCYVGNSPTGWVDPTGLLVPGEEGWYIQPGANTRREPPSGFFGSLSDSVQSIQDAYTGIILDSYYDLDDEAQQFYDRAYQKGPLGQTKDSEGFYYYGTRTALGVSTAATTAAVGLMGGQFLGFQTKVGIHGPHHPFPPFGKLPHFQVNYWQTGVKGSGGAFRIPLPPIR